MQNEKEWNRMIDVVDKLLLDNESMESFRVDLKQIVLKANANIPKRKAFEVVNDILSLTSVCDQHGSWVIAEIEGTEAQISKLTNVRANIPA